MRLRLKYFLEGSRFCDSQSRHGVNNSLVGQAMLHRFSAMKVASQKKKEWLETREGRELRVKMHSVDNFHIFWSLNNFRINHLSRLAERKERQESSLSLILAKASSTTCIMKKQFEVSFLASCGGMFDSYVTIVISIVSKLWKKFKEKLINFKYFRRSIECDVTSNHPLLSRVP